MAQEIIWPPAPPQRGAGGRALLELPRCRPGGTVVCIAGGPSLTQSDVDYVGAAHARGEVMVLGVNNAYLMAPWLDVLYACDFKWWRNFAQPNDLNGGRGALEVEAVKIATTTEAAFVFDIHCIGFEYKPGTEDALIGGLSRDPCRVRTGQNGGYQLVNIACHLVGEGGRIVLLGYDMKPGAGGKVHWWGNYPNRGSLLPTPADVFDKFLPNWPTMVEPLREWGISVVNASADTALEVFPRMALRDVI